MAQNHPVFREPADPNVKIWRYMDFWKFVSLLEEGKLYFSRADRLGDPLEGSFPQQNLQERPHWYGELVKKYEDNGLSVRFPHVQAPLPFLDALSFLRRWFCQWTYVNCWHASEDESAAMWQLYAGRDHGIAIQSTYGRLRACLPQDVPAGHVQYVDYLSATTTIPEGNLLWPFVHKRKSFSHEQEIRAVIQSYPLENGSIAVGKCNSGEGVRVPVNGLDALIEKIYVAHASFADVVKGVVDRYGLDRGRVEPSGLDARPLY
jgi:hypothetical protein